MGTEVSLIDRLREALQGTVDGGWHYFGCQAARTNRPCRCGWAEAKARAEQVLKESLGDDLDVWLLERMKDPEFAAAYKLAEERAVVARWFDRMGGAFMAEVDRLWPDEDDPGYRAGCLAEEAGEVNRAVTKRRHAQRARSGLCKGLTPDEWTGELLTELAQAVGVILDIAMREDFDLVPAVEECLVVLQEREPGT